MSIDLLVTLIVFLFAPIAIGVVLFTILISIKIRNRKYRDFVINYSKAIQQLVRGNYAYRFSDVKDCFLEHDYDNENMYDDIACTDYLIYELAYNSKRILDGMNRAYYNKEQYIKYCDFADKIQCNGNFDEDTSKYNFDKLLKMEKKMFGDLKLKPTISYRVVVTLNYRNMNNRLIKSKFKVYYPEDVSELFREVRKKNGNFYLNENIWNAICKVERGKVTNKMRFAIYARDGHRCKMCGRYTDDLEIDHIIPISKGGKSTYDNLQTLCRSCNKKKGSSIL